MSVRIVRSDTLIVDAISLINMGSFLSKKKSNKSSNRWYENLLIVIRGLI